MSNTFAPLGFSVSGRLDGAAWSGNQREYLIAYNNTHKIYTGDIVVMLSTGLIDTLTPGSTPPLGIFNGCEYISASQGRLVSSPQFPGGDTITNGIVKAKIIDDPNVTFLVQSGWAAGSPIAATQAMVGMNAQWANGTPNTLTGQSGAYLDLNVTPATTSTYAFRILSLVADPPGANGSDTTTAYNNLLVGWNNQFYRQLTGI